MKDRVGKEELVEIAHQAQEARQALRQACVQVQAMLVALDIRQIKDQSNRYYGHAVHHTVHCVPVVVKIVTG